MDAPGQKLEDFALCMKMLINKLFPSPSRLHFIYMHLDRSLETNLDLGDLERELALLPEEAGDLLRLLLRLLPLSLLASGDLNPMGLLSSAFTYRHFKGFLLAATHLLSTCFLVCASGKCLHLDYRWPEDLHYMYHQEPRPSS